MFEPKDQAEMRAEKEVEKYEKQGKVVKWNRIQVLLVGYFKPTSLGNGFEFAKRYMKSRGCQDMEIRDAGDLSYLVLNLWNFQGICGIQEISYIQEKDFQLF